MRNMLLNVISIEILEKLLREIQKQKQQEYLELTENKCQIEINKRKKKMNKLKKKTNEEIIFQSSYLAKRHWFDNWTIDNSMPWR